MGLYMRNQNSTVESWVLPVLLGLFAAWLCGAHKALMSWPSLSPSRLHELCIFRVEVLLALAAVVWLSLDYHVYGKYTEPNRPVNGSGPLPNASGAEAGGNATAEDARYDNNLGFFLYGMSASLRWLGALEFVVAHHELGQFVSSMYWMAGDLCFFSTVWGIVIFAFSTAMLGAGITNPVDEQPMQKWGTWWFLRTYFQSLGEEYMQEMTSDYSNVVLIFMLPIANVLLVGNPPAPLGARSPRPALLAGARAAASLRGGPSTGP